MLTPLLAIIGSLAVTPVLSEEAPVFADILAPVDTAKRSPDALVVAATSSGNSATDFLIRFLVPT